jgi:hypothetical protein
LDEIEDFPERSQIKPNKRNKIDDITGQLNRISLENQNSSIN